MLHAPYGIDGWAKPPEGTIKIKTDAAIWNGMACVAMVARNWHDVVCGVFIFKQMIDVLAAAKAFAILMAATVTKREGWISICFESDAKLVIDNLKSPVKALAH